MLYDETAMWREIHEAPGVLKVLGDENRETLRKIASEFNKRGVRFIYTAARGTSDHAMMYFRYVAETMLGVPVASGAPSVVTMYGAKPDFSGTMVIGCSQSGKAEDVMEVMNRANGCGALTVAITNDADSPLAKNAEFHLYCAADVEKSVAATKTFMSQLYISLALTWEIKNCMEGRVKAVRELRDGKDPREERRGKCAASTEPFLGSGARVSDMSPCDGIGECLERILSEVEKAAETTAGAMKGVSECFILARGISSAAAFECALKLSETCYVRARAYHSSDFYHGPMAMVENGTKVILFVSSHSADSASDDDHRVDANRCVRKMTELGADLMVVTDRDDIPGAVVVPSAGCEMRQIFVFAMFFQMLACRLSTSRGLNPDCPRALQKVTYTR